MINLDVLKLLDLLPSRITDKEMEALAYALDPEMQEITKAIEEIIIMPRIRYQPENIVDNLAWQLHVDFYEPLGLDLDKKRTLVEVSLDWHRRKGTKSVVEEIMLLLFFPNFRVEEWFEYDGKPYFFRAIIGSEPLNQEQLEEAIKAIYITKNERSWLDYITFEHDVNVNSYIAVMMEDYITETFCTSGIPSNIDCTLYRASAMNDNIKEIFDLEASSIASTNNYVSSGI